jgi:acyl-CoA synthetase (NDP forming)
MSDAVAAMLRARSVAVVGASSRVGSFGARMVHEVTRSTAPLEIHLVNPRYTELHGRLCVPTLDDIEGPVDLVLLGVPDSSLEDQLALAARRGDRSAVIFGSVVEQTRPGRPHLTARLATTARAAGMALCGGGCMGFVNVGYGLRAIGYVERDELPTGPVAFVTHSGSAFSAMLRTRRRIGFSLAVSSGQELVTTTADYLHHALDTEGTGIIAVLQETMRDTPRLRSALERAEAQDIPVVALTVGGSPVGREMVAAHSGAIAGDDAAWEALFDAYGVLRVRDLDEMADTLELFGAGRRAAAGPGIATAHDSGAERTLVVDVAHDLGVPFAPLAQVTRATLAELIEPGLVPTNPLDVWGTGADTYTLFTSTLAALAEDPAVAAVALAVDLVVEHDGDDSYPRAAVATWASTDKPVAVLSNMHSAVDAAQAHWLRSQGVPVLEGTRSGLRALGNLLQHRDFRARLPVVAALQDAARRDRWRERLAAGPLTGSESMDLLGDYGIAHVAVQAATTRESAVAAARTVGWPVVLKTDEPGILHKSDVGGVVLGLADPQAVADAYDDIGARLGSRVLVSASAPRGIELALGVVRDAGLGPLVVVAAGGVLVELLADRAVALPPLDRDRATALLDRLAIRPLLDGRRGAPPVDLDPIVTAIVGLSHLALELADDIDALDINPIIAAPHSTLAVDALVVARPRDARH